MGVNENRQSGLDEAVQIGSTAAKVVEGAAKAGKITAAAANGAALGGPYGAAAVLPMPSSGSRTILPRPAPISMRSSTHMRMNASTTSICSFHNTVRTAIRTLPPFLWKI